MDNFCCDKIYKQTDNLKKFTLELSRDLSKKGPAKSTLNLESTLAEVTHADGRSPMK